MRPNVWSWGRVLFNLPQFFSGVVTYRKWKVLFILGLVNSDGGVMVEIKVGLGAANKCCFGLMDPLSSKLLSRRVKCLIYMTLIRPVLTYCSETWAVGK
jgi:hypothetical protein